MVWASIHTSGSSANADDASAQATAFTSYSSAGRAPLAAQSLSDDGAALDVSLFEGFPGGARVQKYIEVCRRLYARYPDKVLMTSEIGGLGWGFEGHISDGVGPISPEAIEHQDGSHGMVGVIPLGFIGETKPDILVSHELFIEDLLKSLIISDYDHTTEPIYTEQDLRLSDTGSLWGEDTLHISTRVGIDDP